MQTHEILKKFFEKKKKGQSGFSMRLLARQLDLSPSFLSRMMSGQKPIPYAVLVPLCKALDVDAETLARLKGSHLVEVEDGKAPRRGLAKVETELEEWDLVGKNGFNVLRQWFYLPILDVTILRDFDGRTETIARRLGISPAAAEVAVRELVHAGLLKEVDGRLVKTRKKFRWGSAKALEDVRKFHHQMMEKAQSELRQATREEEFAARLITGLTVTVSKNRIETAKQRLAEALHEIANDLTQDEGDEVYQLGLQFFPLTKKP